MQLKQIEKTVYRSRLNKVIIAFIVSFAITALGFGQLLIAVFSSPGADNFWLNFFGVLLALITVFSVINHFKHHPYMREVLYVWQLKQQINVIYRKLKAVKSAAFEQKHVDALIILRFYYQACYQLYTLDDNTITLSSLQKEQNTLEDFIEQHALTTMSVESYQQQLLAQF